jgi:hypothetical protein
MRLDLDCYFARENRREITHPDSRAFFQDLVPCRCAILDEFAVATYGDSQQSSGLIALNYECVIRSVEHLDRARDFDRERAAARGAMNNEHSEKQCCDQSRGW